MLNPLKISFFRADKGLGNTFSGEKHQKVFSTLLQGFRDRNVSLSVGEKQLNRCWKKFTVMILVYHEGEG